MAVTLRDIAKRVNLSHATVSFVLNDRKDIAIPEATRKRVLKVAEELGYRPNPAARALVKGHTQMVCLRLPNLCRPMNAKILSLLQSHLTDSGYEAILAQHAMSQGMQPLDWPVDGTIYVNSTQVHAESASYTPFAAKVCVGIEVDPTADHVTVDLRTGATEAIHHLLSKKCKRIGLVVTKQQGDGRKGFEEGYESVVLPQGIQSEIVEVDDQSLNSIREGLRGYFKTHGCPDGLLCISDEIALAGIRTAKEVQKKADGMRFVGCGGLEIAEYSTPTLSTLALPLEAMADKAWKFLIERMRTKGIEQQIATLPVQLLIRESSQ